MSRRRDDFVAADTGKLQHNKIISLPIISEIDTSEGIVQGIHYRFVNDPDFRACQLEHDRDEEVCIKMDELAQKDFGHHMTQEEYCRYRMNWWISLINF